jgi:hypothetical protein
MPEFRVKVPEDRRRDRDFVDEQEATVREHLSRCCSPVDGVELAGEVVVTSRRSRDGGYWVHGVLDREVSHCETPVPDSALAGLRAAQVGKSTDLSRDELREHMARKGDR